MPVLDSILVAIFCLVFVFVVLAVLFVFIRVFSVGVGAIANKANKPLDAVPVAAPIMSAAAPITSAEIEANFSSGGLRLNNVDERTAAIIMAIVSDESGIPLSELCFKSIKQLSK